MKLPVAILLAVLSAGLLIPGWYGGLAQATMVGSVRLTEYSGGGMERLVALIVLILTSGLIFQWKRSVAIICGAAALGILGSVLYSAWQWRSETLSQLEAMGVNTGEGGNFKIEWGSAGIYLGLSLIFLLVLLRGLSYSQGNTRRKTRSLGISDSKELLNPEHPD